MTNLLTIGIPTFNRGSILEKKLGLLSQLRDLDQLDILVSDNGSHDDTQYVVQRYQSKFPNLLYSRNPTNIGYDNNILAILEKAKTQYIWFLGDDDEFSDQVISEILNILKRHAPSIICLNDSRDGVTTQICKHQSQLSFRPLFDQTIILTSLTHYDRYLLVDSFFWLSRLVINKYQLASATAYNSYVGTFIMQLALVNYLLVNSCEPTIYFCSLPLLTNNPHNIYSYNFVNVFVSTTFAFYSNPLSQFSTRIARLAARRSFSFVSEAIKQQKMGTTLYHYQFKFFSLIPYAIKYRLRFHSIVKLLMVCIIPPFCFKALNRTKPPSINTKDRATYI